MSAELEIFGFIQHDEAEPLSIKMIEEALRLPRLNEKNPRWSIDMPSKVADYGAEIFRNSCLDSKKATELPNQTLQEAYLTSTIPKPLQDKTSGINVLPSWQSNEDLILI